MSNNVTAIIVTHNSENCLEKCLDHLYRQSHPPSEIIVVDSGSSNKKYLVENSYAKRIHVIFEENIGFSRANNRGYEQKSSLCDYVLFLNPDTFVEKDFIENALVELRDNPRVGVLSGKLHGYNVEQARPTGRLDSTGIFRKIYGRWYDRVRNQKDVGRFSKKEEVPALCGALLFCRVKCLEQLGKKVFNEAFFLYKEDIEFSLRIRKIGWKLLYVPELQAYHCRGWQKRKRVDVDLKKTAARSEILLYKEHPSPYIIWAYLKYWLVNYFRI